MKLKAKNIIKDNYTNYTIQRRVLYIWTCFIGFEDERSRDQALKVFTTLPSYDLIGTIKKHKKLVFPTFREIEELGLVFMFENQHHGIILVSDVSHLKRGDVYPYFRPQNNHNWQEISFEQYLSKYEKAIKEQETIYEKIESL